MPSVRDALALNLLEKQRSVPGICLLRLVGIQAHALSQVPRSGDQADAGRCQVCWRYTECAQCFGWVPPGIQSTCFCSLLRHLAYFQIRAGNSVCTNRAAQKIFSALFRIFLLRSIALACLLRYTHFGNNKTFHLRFIVISSQ